MKSPLRFLQATSSHNSNSSNINITSSNSSSNSNSQASQGVASLVVVSQIQPVVTAIGTGIATVGVIGIGMKDPGKAYESLILIYLLYIFPDNLEIMMILMLIYVS